MSFGVCVCFVGDRAEGAEDKLESGLSKLTLTQPSIEDSGNDPEIDPYTETVTPELTTSSPAPIILLNSV